MAYAPLALTLQGLTLPKFEARKGPGLFALLFAAMAESRQRQADREIARFMAGRGGKFTDEMEREIERRFLTGTSFWLALSTKRIQETTRCPLYPSAPRMFGPASRASAPSSRWCSTCLPRRSSTRTPRTSVIRS